MLAVARWSGVLAVALVAAATGCTRVNPAYCDPDHPCADGLVCSAETNACVPDDGCQDASCLCGGPEDCPADAADCVAGTCQACTEGDRGDAACVASDDATPVCVAGGCVQCGDNADCVGFGDDRPHCDQVDFTCGPCQRDDECSTGVCDEDAGACLDEAALIHVAKGGDDAGACDAAAPCLTITGALTKVADGRATIVVHEDVAAFQEALVLASAAFAVERVTIVGAAGERPVVVPTFDLDGVAVVGGGVEFRLERLALRGGSLDGVECRDGARVTLIDLAIEEFDGLGVDAVDCDLVLRRSVVASNQSGGVSLFDGTSFAIDNTAVVRNGFGIDADVGGVRVISSTGTLEFSTIAGNRIGIDAASPGIECVGALTFRNNIAYGNRPTGGGGDDDVSDDNGSDCRHAYSIIGESLDDAQDAGNNRSDDPLLSRDDGYHLLAGSPAIDTAEPAATLAIDLDGEARPAGAARDVGADERP